MPAESKLDLGLLLCIWLAVILLNLAGLASIIDSFLTWEGYFRQAIDFYRTWVREPILSIAYLVWPLGWPRLPGWVIDVLCISGSYLGLSIVEGAVFDAQTLDAKAVCFYWLMLLGTLMLLGVLSWHLKRAGVV